MFKSILKKMNVDDSMNEEEKAAAEAPTGETAESGSAGTAAPEILREKIIEVLRTVYDPEIPVNIYELGLIYEINLEPNGFATVRMTLTSPACPVAGTLPGEVEQKVKSVEGVPDAKVELVWEPSWNMSMMSEAARLQLNMM